MPDWLFERSTIIALAVAGGVLSLLVSLFRSNSWGSEQLLHLLNRASYVFMGASMVLFVLAGLFGVGADPR